MNYFCHFMNFQYNRKNWWLVTLWDLFADVKFYSFLKVCSNLDWTKLKRIKMMTGLIKSRSRMTDQSTFTRRNHHFHVVIEPEWLSSSMKIMKDKRYLNCHFCSILIPMNRGKTTYHFDRFCVLKKQYINNRSVFAQKLGFMVINSNIWKICL